MSPERVGFCYDWRDGRGAAPISLCLATTVVDWIAAAGGGLMRPISDRRRTAWLLVALLAAGCAPSGNWTKAGADEAAAAREYEDCRAMATTAVRTDADIDQDILATRGGDWQRAGIVRQQARTMQEHTRDRRAAVVDACMRAKGFGRAR